MFNYLVVFFIPDSGWICRLADEIAKETGIHPPHLWLPPHVTFHRPIIVADEGEVRKRLSNAVTRAKRSRMTIGGHLGHYGRKYIVLPVWETFEVVSLWTGLHDEFARLHGYERSGYDRDNTLHSSLAEVPSDVYRRVWPKARLLKAGSIEVALTRLDLLRKPVSGGRWEMVASFPLPA